MRKLFVLLMAMGLTGALVLKRAAHAPLPSGKGISVMTYNMGDVSYRPTVVKDLAELIKARGVPDVLLLQEVPGEKAASRLGQLLGLGSTLYMPYRSESRTGLAILARGLLDKPNTLYFKASRVGRGALISQMTFENETVAIGSVHMDHISEVNLGSKGVVVSWKDALKLLVQELTSESIRSQCATELIQWLPSLGFQRTIIGGDFNTVPFSKTIRLMNGHFHDVLWPSLDFFKGSYHKLSLPVHPRIDYIFFSSDMSCQEAGLLKETVGDHYPVQARFIL